MQLQLSLVALLGALALAGGGLAFAWSKDFNQYEWKYEDEKDNINTLFLKPVIKKMTSKQHSLTHQLGLPRAQLLDLGSH